MSLQDYAHRFIDIDVVALSEEEVAQEAAVNFAQLSLQANAALYRVSVRTGQEAKSPAIHLACEPPPTAYR